MALEQRKPKGVIHRSDQGNQYTSLAFGERCGRCRFAPGWKRWAMVYVYDNAMAECFFVSLERELIERSTLQSKTQARMAVFT